MYPYPHLSFLLMATTWLAAAIPAGAQQPAATPPAPSWMDKLDFSGDLRLRHESSWNLPSTPSSRHRERVRGRFGVIYHATEELSVEARLRTGDPDNPQNPYVDLGGSGSAEAFDSFTVSFDRLNARYATESWWGAGGKFAHPFWSNPLYGELVWDADVNPDGFAAGASSKDTFLDQLTLAAGEYVILEQAAGEDAFATVAQLSASEALGQNSKLSGAVGYYHYYDATPGGATAIVAGENSGNATNGAGTDFLSNFGVLNPILAFTIGSAAHPITVSGEYIKNLRAEISEDQGYALGVAYGSTKAAGDWQAYYQWQLVEQDAVFTAFNGDDFTMQTNFLGHILSWTYMFENNIGLRLWSLIAKPDMVPAGGSDEYQYRFRVDFTITF